MKRFLSGMRGCCRFVALLAVLARGVAGYGLKPRHRRDAVTRARWLQRTCRRALRVLEVRVVERGARPERVLIGANHLSYLDIIVLAACCPVVFVSKREVRNWPLFGWFAEKAGTRFIDRNRRGDVVRTADELTPAIEAGLTVVVFLEGTTTAGDRVLPFKSSLLEPAVRARWRVVPTALDYQVPAGRSAPTEVCWWGDMTLPPHLLNITTLPWIEAHVAWGHVEVADGDRKELATRLHRQVVQLKSSLAKPGLPRRSPIVEKEIAVEPSSRDLT